MASFAAKTLLALAVTATALVPLNSASAGDWRHRHHDRGGEALALGVIGLAAGVAVGSALAQPQYEERVYVEPQPVRRYPAYAQPEYDYYAPDYRAPHYQPAPRPVYRAQPVYQTIEPWSEAWYDYCSQRYRSFNSQSGTYTDYSGQRHFCTAG